jgi:hypothetical protein
VREQKFFVKIVNAADRLKEDVSPKLRLFESKTSKKDQGFRHFSGLRKSPEFHRPSFSFGHSRASGNPGPPDPSLALAPRFRGGDATEECAG